ncbi:unnamed protein product [Absidia cylindrospora]
MVFANTCGPMVTLRTRKNQDQQCYNQVYSMDCKLSTIIAATADNERTPFPEHLIPIFKRYAATTSLMEFTWANILNMVTYVRQVAIKTQLFMNYYFLKQLEFQNSLALEKTRCEKDLVANRHGVILPPQKWNIWSHLDGIGISICDGAECSSGENVDHSCNGIYYAGQSAQMSNFPWWQYSEYDTVKQMPITSNCLMVHKKKYQPASFDGLQFIHDRTTLTSIHMVDKERYSFIEVRSAKIPTSFVEQRQWARVFELHITQVEGCFWLCRGILEEKMVWVGLVCD